MAKRFQTYFRVPIPPWKEKKLGAGAITVRFVLTGRVPSKKNQQQGVAVRKEAIAFLKKQKSVSKKQAIQAVKMVYAKVRPNNEYVAFVQAQKPILIEQMAYWSSRLQHKGLTFPLTHAALNLHFYFHAQYVQDTVNKQQSVQDLLKEAGVIMNDDYGTLNPVKSASASYHEEIINTITLISLTFKLP